MELGNIIKNKRKELHMTQGDLADKLYVSRQTISKWESNILQPDMQNFIELCKLFNCSAENLLGKEKDNFNEKIENKKDDVSNYLLVLSLIISIALLIFLVVLKKVFTDTLIVISPNVYGFLSILLFILSVVGLTIIISRTIENNKDGE